MARQVNLSYSCGLWSLLAIVSPSAALAQGTPPRGQWFVLDNRQAAIEVFDGANGSPPRPADLQVVIGFPEIDDGGFPLQSFIQVHSFPLGVVARYQLVDPQVLGGEGADWLTALASKLGGHHFGWFQVITDIANSATKFVAPDGTELIPPHVDPMRGGYGDNPQTPTINDGLASDILPWYFRHGPVDLSPFGAGTMPLISTPERELFTEKQKFWYEDAPFLPVSGTIEYSTWLTLLDADNSLNRILPGFGWSYSKNCAGCTGSTSVGSVLAPISAGEFMQLTDSFASAGQPEGGPVNGNFSQQGVFGWSVTPAGNAATVDDPNASDGFAVTLTANSPVTISQAVDTPDEAFSIILALLFASTEGHLDIRLDDRLILTVDAFESVDGTYQDMAAMVSDPLLTDMDGVQLAITYDGPIGSSVNLDTVSFAVIPEPSGLTLLGFVSLLLLLNVRRPA